MKKELNNKKLYVQPKINVIPLDCESICITCSIPGGSSSEDPDNGEGEEYFHGRLN